MSELVREALRVCEKQKRREIIAEASHRFSLFPMPRFPMLSLSHPSNPVAPVRRDRRQCLQNKRRFHGTGQKTQTERNASCSCSPIETVRPVTIHASHPLVPNSCREWEIRLGASLPECQSYSTLRVLSFSGELNRLVPPLHESKSR